MRIILNIGNEALLLKKEAPLNAILNALDETTPVKRDYNKIWRPSRYKDAQVEVVVISDAAALEIENEPEEQEAVNG